MRVLVAGLTGQLGCGLVETLTDARIELHPVVRPIGRRAGAERIRRRFAGVPELAERTVDGDVTRPLWGVAREDVDRLRGRVDAVLDLAGETNWAAPASRLTAVNVNGAANGLELARALAGPGGPPLYCYASSIHAAGGIEGWIPERALGPDGRRTAYEQSKWLAEQVLQARARAGGVPLAIARVGGLVGSSETGATAKRNSLYVLADEWRRLPGRLLPLTRRGRVDMLPRDDAGRLLARLLGALRLRPPRTPEIVHVCAGESAPTSAALLAVVRAADPYGAVALPRTARFSPRPLTWLSEHLDRVHELTPTTSNMLWGLRYLTLDRLFERSRIGQIVGGDLPSPSVEQLARLVFDVPDLTPEPAVPRPLARFAG